MIVVAGENLVDLVLDERGKVAARPGGGPYNTARTVSRLGEACAYLGAIGTDGFGRLIRTKLELDGVDLSLVSEVDEPTALAVAEVDAGGSARYHFHHLGTAAPLVAAPPPGWSDGVDALHVGTLGLVWEPMASVLAGLVEREAADASRTTVMVDANCRPAAIADREAYLARLRRVVAHSDIVKVSTEDLDYVLPGAGVADGAAELLALGTSVVLVSAGGDAAHVVTAAGTRTVAPPPVEVIDTIGAGDAFGGAFLAYWVRHGWDAAVLPELDELAAALEFSCLVGAKTCQTVGADPPNASALPPF